jgi:hypothetical protein
MSLLLAHPSTPNDTVRSLRAQLQADLPGVLMFRYVLDADMARVRVPQGLAEEPAGGPTDALWKHTCFEAFVGPADAPDYYEFNFSPARHWAIYRFSAYREAMPAGEKGRAPRICVRHSERGLELEATVHLERLPGLRGVPRLRVGLTAVIEDDGGRLSYWGLKHPLPKPDFHHSGGFALEVARA